MEVTFRKVRPQLAQMAQTDTARMGLKADPLLLTALQCQEAQRDKRGVLATAAAAAVDMILIKIYITTEPLEMAQIQGREVLGRQTED